VLAVIDAQLAAAAVLAGFCHVGAQLVDDQPDAGRGEAGDPLPGLGVRRAVVVRAEQRVDELCRARDYAATVTGGRVAAGEDGLLGLPGGWRGRHSSSPISHF
jgi:hypothetical protein